MFPPLHIDGPPIPLARCYKAEEVSISEITLQRCSYEKVFWKYAANLLENTDAEVWFQWSSFATLLKLHFGMRALFKFAAYFQSSIV